MASLYRKQLVVIVSYRFHALVAALLLSAQLVFPPQVLAEESSDLQKVGVLYLVHGGHRSINYSNFFDAGIQMASYDENSSTYKNTIWQPENWHRVVPLSAGRQASEVLGLLRKSIFKLARAGTIEPVTQVTEAPVVSLQAALDRAAASTNTEFVVDWVAWITGSSDVGS